MTRDFLKHELEVPRYFGDVPEWLGFFEISCQNLSWELPSVYALYPSGGGVDL